MDRAGFEEMTEYQGPERRQGYIQMDKDFQDFKLEVKEYIAGLKQWQIQTIEYIKLLCEKIDKIDITLSNHITDITKKIYELPCKERSALFTSFGKQIRWLWTITGGLMLGIIADWIRKR